jgi:hypothetical protein
MRIAGKSASRAHSGTSRTLAQVRREIAESYDALAASLLIRGIAVSNLNAVLLALAYRRRKHIIL